MWYLEEIVRRNRGEKSADDDVVAQASPERLAEFVHDLEVTTTDLDADDFAWVADLTDEPAPARFVRETITTYAVIDDEGYVVETFDSFDEAKAVAAGDQVVELTGEGFVRERL